MKSVKTGFLVNGLAALLMVLLTTTHAEARTKRSETAKVEFKQQHPCPTTGAPKGPCKGYVIDHIIPIACHGAVMHRATCSGRPRLRLRRKINGSGRCAGSESA